MIRMLLFSADRGELHIINELISQLVAEHHWAECELKTTDNLMEWSKWVKHVDQIDALLCDVTVEGAVAMLKLAKKAHSKALVIPIADITVVPTTYVQPDIMPYALFWRPLTEQSGKTTVADILSHVYTEKKNKTAKFFKVETRQRTQCVPYQEMYYFEAREKKIFLRTKYEEICFYATLSQLEKQLSSQFMRCHKGYLVNTAHIVSVDWSQQLIELDGSIRVPLSKSYKNSFKERFHEI